MIVDIIVIILLLISAFDYEILGLDKAPVCLLRKHKQYFDLFPWIVFAVLVFDLYLNIRS